MIETIARREEMEAAIRAAREIAPDLPIVAQMSFNEDGRTVRGDEAGDLAGWMRDLGADVVGANCAIGPKPMLECLEAMSRRGDFLLAAQPNAGTPQWFEGRYIYFSSPEYMADLRAPLHLVLRRAPRRRLLRHDPGPHPRHERDGPRPPSVPRRDLGAGARERRRRRPSRSRSPSAAVSPASWRRAVSP